MSTEVTELIEKIEQKRQQAKLNESVFSERLGISRANWYLIKKRGRLPGVKFLRAVMRVFPELQLDVMNYLAKGDGDAQRA